jgi:hexosaminidase
MSINSQLNILPTPQYLKKATGDYVFNSDIVISGKKSSSTLLLQKVLKDELKFSITISSNPPLNSNVIKFLSIKEDQKLLQEKGLYANDLFKKEGYILEIDNNKIVVQSNTQAGFYYAIQSLQYLLQSRTGPNAIPCCLIIDWPNFAMRGITDDISRGQVSTMDNFKKIIKFIAHNKMNIYMPYLEDLVHFKTYPSIGKNRGALGTDEILELQKYAAEHHVEIIPIFQTLGHWENLLFQDEFVDLADFPGSASLDVTSEKVYEFLENMISEIAPIFESVYFHMGADESFDVGRGATRQAAKRHGIASVHAKHYNRVIEIIKKYDKKIMMYGDIVLQHPMILNEIPKDVILFDWHYEASEHYASTEIFSKANQPFIVSPGIQNWSRIFPDLAIALANTKQFIKDGYDNGAIGAITSNWGDFGGANFRELNYYPYAYAAEMAWNVNGADLVHFEKNFFQDFYGAENSTFASVYHLLSKMSDYYDLDHLFAHPFYPMENKLDKNIQRAYEHEHFSFQLKREINALRLVASRNRAHLDYLELCANMYQWIGKLSNAKVQLYQLLNYQYDSPRREGLVLDLEKRLLECYNDLDEIYRNYEILWCLNNKPDNLLIILGLLERVKIYLKAKKNDLQIGNFEFNGRLDSSFITHPRGIVQGHLDEVYLRKEINISKIPEKAWLQIIANSHAFVWINGKIVGHVVARRSLSGVAEQWRVKAWKVKEYLVEGVNTIAVRVRNYVPEENASANIWFECLNDNLLIKSDEHWKAFIEEEPNWLSANYDDSYWVPATIEKNNWIIAKPYFANDLPSRIEFFSETVDF